ncbi:MAG: cellulose synthase, partial [Nostoc sp.]
QIVRVTPINDTQTLLGVDFVKLNSTQSDALTIVLYSDVREWYSQKAQYVDQPLASLGFLATSLTRALRDLNQTNRTKVRKQVNTNSQLYWDGNFFFGVATELGTTGLRLEIEDKKAVSSHKMLGQQDLHNMRTVKPLVGLLLNEDAENFSSNRFVAEIYAVEEQANGKIAIELIFPEKFKERQDTKIKQLLQVL